MWIPPSQFSNEDPTLSKGFTSRLLFSDPALLPSAMCYPSVLPFRFQANTAFEFQLKSNTSG